MIYQNNKKVNLKAKILRYIKYGKKYDTDINKKEENILISDINYVRLIKNKQIKPLINYSLENVPKLSFVSSVYNKGKYIDLLIISIQTLQDLEFEITLFLNNITNSFYFKFCCFITKDCSRNSIFVDDCSKDKSINVIKHYMKIDKRIKLIKNKRNKGSLYSRSIGAFNSKAEYIIFVDSDDIIISRGIFNIYKFISNRNLSMVQYNSLIQKKGFISVNKLYDKYKNIITQPLLSYIFYFDNNTPGERNSGLWDKIIKREIVIKSLLFIGKNYISKNIRIENDVILLFSILKNSNSYQYINEFGYYYIRTHNESISNKWEDPKIADDIIKSIVFTVDFLFEKTENTSLDKQFSSFKLKQSLNRYKLCFKYSKYGRKLIKNIFDKLLKSEFISNRDKLHLMNFETEISFLKGDTKYLFLKKI